MADESESKSYVVGTVMQTRHNQRCGPIYECISTNQPMRGILQIIILQGECCSQCLCFYDVSKTHHTDVDTPTVMVSFSSQGVNQVAKSGQGRRKKDCVSE